jgi:DNA-binding response OmpR family regulator
VCILIVEDEDLIRLILAEELEDAGFDVCQAEDGDAAAALIAKPPTPFSLLVTDIHMPGRLDGLEVGRLMRNRHPAVPIIYMTGRPDALALIGSLRAKDSFLLKPFTPSRFLAVARRLLA